jgi:hypothetical protein
VWFLTRIIAVSWNQNKQNFFIAPASDHLGMENLAPQGFLKNSTEMKAKNQMGRNKNQ